MTDLKHLIYASQESENFSSEDIIALLKQARERNKKLDVTGMLLFDKGSFLQILEGEESIVDHLFEEITKDRRHDHVVKIISEPIAERHFKDWSMGHAEVTREELEQVEGMNDFFAGNRCLLDIDRGRAMNILKAFSKGQWRLS